MRTRPLLLPGVFGALVLGGALVVGLPKAVYAQDSLGVVETGVWIGIQTDTARVFISATGETTLVIRVTGIQQGGPADAGGVLRGDVIVALNGRELVDYEAWLNSLAALGPGQQARLRLNRGGAEVETTVVVADQRPPSFPARLDLPGFDAAWDAMLQDFEALMATLPDTLGPRVELSTWIRGRVLLDSSAVSLTFGDTTTMTLDTGRADSSRTPPVPDEPEITGRLRSADPEGPAGRRATEAERTLVVDSTAFLRGGADSVLVEQGQVPRAQSGELTSRTEVVLLSSVVLGGAQVRTLSSALGRSYFGVSSGVLIVDVLASGPARRAGFRPGDVIVAVGGRELETLAQLRIALALADLPVSVSVIRHGERVELTYPVR